MGLDKVVQISKGVFIVGFHAVTSNTKAVKQGIQMFDQKPVVVKPW